jgi:hypothetical protein
MASLPAAAAHQQKTSSAVKRFLILQWLSIKVSLRE